MSFLNFKLNKIYIIKKISQVIFPNIFLGSTYKRTLNVKKAALIIYKDFQTTLNTLYILAWGFKNSKI